MPICPTFIPRVTVLEELILLEFVRKKKSPFSKKGLLAIILLFPQLLLYPGSDSRCHETLGDDLLS